MHDENNEKEFFIMILKKNRDNRELIVNALNKAIFKVNHLKNIVQKFIETAKYKLWLKSFSFNIKEEIQRIIKQTSFVSMYSEMYNLFC